MDEPLLEYLLRLGDTDLVLAQRLGAWVGHGPALEEDIALANVGLDLLGQARLWLGYAGEVEARLRGRGRSEDELAFLRDAPAFRNVQLVEQPNGDYAATIARQLYFDHAHHLLLQGLAQSFGRAHRGDRARRASRRRSTTSSARPTGSCASATARRNRTRACSARSTTCGRSPGSCSPSTRSTPHSSLRISCPTSRRCEPRGTRRSRRCSTKRR